MTFFDSFSFSNYSLCEITVEDGGLIKQRRLPDMLTSLPERIHLNGRSVNSLNSVPVEPLLSDHPNVKPGWSLSRALTTMGLISIC